MCVVPRTVAVNAGGPPFPFLGPSAPFARFASGAPPAPLISRVPERQNVAASVCGGANDLEHLRFSAVLTVDLLSVWPFASDVFFSFSP